MILLLFFLFIRRPPRSTPLYSSAASDVYNGQLHEALEGCGHVEALVDSPHVGGRRQDLCSASYLMRATMVPIGILLRQMFSAMIPHGRRKSPLPVEVSFNRTY